MYLLRVIDALGEIVGSDWFARRIAWLLCGDKPIAAFFSLVFLGRLRI